MSARRTWPLSASLVACALVAIGALVAWRARVAEERQRNLWEFTGEDADLSAVIADLSSFTGRKIVLGRDVHETVTISLRGIPWRDALDVIAKMTKCEVMERGDEILVDQPSLITLECTDAPLRSIVPLLAAYSGDNVVLGSDVQGTATLSYRRCSIDHGPALREKLGAILSGRALYLARVGSVLVVATSPVTTSASTGVPRPETSIWAWGASPRGWCRLLEPYLGRRIVVPELPGAIDCMLTTVSFEDALAASAAANGYTVSAEPPDALRWSGGRESRLPARAPCRVELSDHEKLTLLVEGIVHVPDRDSRGSRALLSGVVYAVGDGVKDEKDRVVGRVSSIAIDSITLTLADGRTIVCKPN